MKLVPARPFDTESKAEVRVFDALASTEFPDHHPKGFHSLLLTHHEQKRVGEADFVILSIYGLFVLEVKGGSIKLEDGKWTATGMNGANIIQDPFHQANTAVHAIKNKVDEFLGTNKKRFSIGYGVVFPDCKFSQYGSEWEREMVCDREDLRNFNHWLRSLFNYWHDRPNNDILLTQSDVDVFSLILRPSFELIQPIFEQVKQVERSSVQLTEEQYRYVDIAMDNQRVICSGGAGTGKTFLAAELARRMLNEGKNVLLICKSSWLRHYLTARIPSDGLFVATISSVSSVIRRSGLDSFDVAIIDEGQDLLNSKDLNQLDSILTNGFTHGQWYFFHDSNNQSNLLSKVEPGALDWLKSQANPTNLKLTINCRNTTNILSAIQSELKCDVGNPTLVDGPEVTEYRITREHTMDKLEVLLEELQNSELDMGTITILSPVQKRTSIVSELSSKVQDTISELDDYRVRKFPYAGITFAQIKDFKGLENDVIILVDMPHPDTLKADESTALHYVGMSRARAMLYCFWDAERQA